MDNFFAFVKILANIQFAIVVILILLAYSVKIYFYYKMKYRIKMQQQLRVLLLNCQEGIIELSPKLYRLFCKDMYFIVNILNESNNIRFCQYILHDLLLPQARKSALAKQWIKRYLYCYVLSSYVNQRDKMVDQNAVLISAADEIILYNLIDDPRPLIAINAAKLALQCASQKLVNHVIEVGSAGRRVQQEFYAHISIGAQQGTGALIMQRLQYEPEPYVRIFCYRLLNQLPYYEENTAMLQMDLASDHLDLQLTVLAYCQYIHYSELHQCLLILLKDPRWEIRARAVKLLGTEANMKFIQEIELSLRDSVWWVRINAAEALAKLGEAGVVILKKQNSDEDQYAYDAASLVLSTLMNKS